MKFVSFLFTAFLASAVADSSFDEYDHVVEDHDAALRGSDERNLGKKAQDYCVLIKEKNGIQEWETMKLTKDELDGFSDYYKGKCQKLCEKKICDHQPCFEDFLVQGDKCFCYDRSDDKCDTNASCKKEECVCDETFFGNGLNCDCHESATKDPRTERCTCNENATWNKKTGECDCVDPLVRDPNDPKGCICENDDKEYDGNDCVCKGDLVEDEDGKCGCLFGINAQGTDCPCDTRDGWEEVKDQCVCKPGAVPDGKGNCICTDDFTSQAANGNACKCKDGSNDDETEGVCECNETWERNADGVCACPYGTTEDNGECVCDEANGFFDDDAGGCECAIGSVDNGKGQCICEGLHKAGPGLDGNFCGCVDDADHDDATGECFCDDNYVRDDAACVCNEKAGFSVKNRKCDCHDRKEPHQNKNKNKCVCKKQFVKGEDGACVCPFGADDGDDACPCLPTFEPVNGKCKCRPGATYDKNNKRCECQFPHVENSNSKDGPCDCVNDDFKKNGKGLCVPV